MIRKNDILEVEILNLGINGEGVARHDGVVLFVPFALAGEKVIVQVINTKQKAYICKLLEVLVSSPYRTEPRCIYFRKCGGCQLQHLDYDKSLEFKTKLVQDAITHIGKVDYKVNDCIKSHNVYEYRNKFAFPVDEKTRTVGMFRTASHSIVPIEKCAIQKGRCGDLIEIFNEYLKFSKSSIYNEETNSGLIRHFVVREVDNKYLITVVVNGDKLIDNQFLIDNLNKHGFEFGLNININKESSNVILSNDYIHLYGLKDIEVEEYGIKYSINNASFMQVNDYIKQNIYDSVLSEIDEDMTVVDAYSGAGLLTAIISKKCKFAYGIEIVEPAIRIANILKEKNKIANMKNICGDATIELPKLVKSIKDKFSVVIDPPRKGCSKVVVETIAKVKPEKLIYISCNPSTLARDIYNFNQATSDYKIKYIQPFDMFPHTKHVETLLVMEKK